MGFFYSYYSLLSFNLFLASWGEKKAKKEILNVSNQKLAVSPVNHREDSAQIRWNLLACLKRVITFRFVLILTGMEISTSICVGLFIFFSLCVRSKEKKNIYFNLIGSIFRRCYNVELRMGVIIQKVVCDLFCREERYLKLCNLWLTVKLRDAEGKLSN